MSIGNGLPVRQIAKVVVRVIVRNCISIEKTCSYAKKQEKHTDHAGRKESLYIRF